MDLIKNLQDHVGTRPEKFFKETLFRSDTLLLGINCLDPGQVQKPHDHADQDKFYYVVEGEGHFWLGEEQRVVGQRPGGVGPRWRHPRRQKMKGTARLTLLVGIAPAPHRKDYYFTRRRKANKKKTFAPSRENIML